MYQCLYCCFLSLIFVVSIKSYQVLALIPLIAKGYILLHFLWVFSSDIDGSTLCVLTSSSTKEWITVHYLKVPNVNPLKQWLLVTNLFGMITPSFNSEREREREQPCQVDTSLLRWTSAIRWFGLNFVE